MTLLFLLFIKISRAMAKPMTPAPITRKSHVLNAVSPAWTCALSFAKYVYEFMKEKQN